MKNDELLYKITNNKLLLFIVPHLIYISVLLHYYNVNLSEGLELFFYEVWVLFLIFFIVTTLIYFLLRKMLNNYQKIFCLLCFICTFYFVKLNLFQLLSLVIMVLLLVIDFKKIIKFKLDNFVGFVSLIIFFLFSYNLFSAICGCLSFNFKTKTYDNVIDINVEEELKSPDIYWIHCDGMLGIESMQKYFGYKDIYLTDYFYDNNFYVNEDATLISGRKTQMALVAMFNPYYYDNFFKNYLLELNNSYVDDNIDTSFEVGYSELEEKRLDNELFRALAKKNYTTVAVGEFNQYTSLNTNYYYDYYFQDNNIRHINEDKVALKSISTNNSDFRKKIYSRFIHFHSLLNRTIFYDVFDDINFLEYEEVDYSSYDTSEYDCIDNSDYWISKAIIKSLDESLKIDKKFVFVDYNLNHLPLTYDYDGNRLDVSNEYNLGYYLGNYIYSMRLLVDMLEFIKNNDEDAVIIVQADHGIHMLEDKQILNYFNTDMEGVQEIRNSVISAMYIPEKYRNGDEGYLDNPLNISRYIVNNFIGKNYEYIK